MSDMLQIKLARLTEIEEGTFGCMSLRGVPLFVTVEPNWRNNGKNSCIPAGVHACKSYSSEKYPNTIEIIVPGRDKILIHNGNLEDDSLGCIILGKKFGLIKNKIGVMESAVALKEFREITKKYTYFRLTIIDCTK